MVDALMTSFVLLESSIMPVIDDSWLVMAILAVLAAFALTYLRCKMKEMNLRLRGIMRDALSLLELHAVTPEVEEQVRALYHDHFEIIHLVCTNYYEAHGTPMSRASIVMELTQEIENISRDSLLPEKREEIIDQCCDGVVTRLRSCAARFTGSEIDLIVYIACGFSVRSVSTITDDTIESLYIRMSSIRHKAASLPDSLRRFVISLL